MAFAMDDRIYQGYLFDFYGELLKPHRREVYEQYIFDDLSLNEIAELRGVSRQSVFDLVKRVNESLTGYEAKLHLVEKFLSVRKKAETIEELSRKGGEDLGRIHDLAASILEEL